MIKRSCKEFRAEFAKVYARLESLEKPEGILTVVDEGLEGNQVPSKGEGLEEPEGEQAEIAQIQASVTRRSSLSTTDEPPLSLVHFSQSAWSYPIVIGLVDVGLWDVVFSILLMLVNLGCAAVWISNILQ